MANEISKLVQYFPLINKICYDFLSFFFKETGLKVLFSEGTILLSKGTS